MKRRKRKGKTKHAQEARARHRRAKARHARKNQMVGDSRFRMKKRSLKKIAKHMAPFVRDKLEEGRQMLEARRKRPVEDFV